MSIGEAQRKGAWFLHSPGELEPEWSMSGKDRAGVPKPRDKNHLEDLLKHRLLNFSSRVCDLLDLG